MASSTSIEWTNKTWNPVTGCTKVSPGCKHCYAETVAERFWKKQYPGRAGFTEVRCHPERLDEPLRWRKPSRIFVNSMSDLFHEKIPNEFIAAVCGVMAAAPRHTFQVLTKRPARMLAWFGWMRSVGTTIFERDRAAALDAAVRYGVAPERINDGTDGTSAWPLPNLHIGTSIENQETADERIPFLLQTPAAVRFVSVEPLLGPVSLRWLSAWPENAPTTALKPSRLRGEPISRRWTTSGHSYSIRRGMLRNGSGTEATTRCRGTPIASSTTRTGGSSCGSV